MSIENSVLVVQHLVPVVAEQLPVHVLAAFGLQPLPHIVYFAHLLQDTPALTVFWLFEVLFFQLPVPVVCSAPLFWYVPPPSAIDVFQPAIAQAALVFQLLQVILIPPLQSVAFAQSLFSALLATIDSVFPALPF